MGNISESQPRESKGKQHLKEVEASTDLNVVYVIDRFPGYGFVGGGAERKLQNIVTHLPDIHKNYLPQIFVRQPPDEISPYTSPKKDNQRNYELFNPIITNWTPEKPDPILANNMANTILHLFDSSLVLYNPEVFQRICNQWKGPIIQRITLLERISQIRAAHPINLLDYLAPITVFVSQSDEITQALLEIGLPSDRIAEINYGVDLSVFYPAESSDQKASLRSRLFPLVKPDNLCYLFTGRISDPNKKVNELIQSWNESGFGRKGHYLILAGQHRPGDISPSDPLVKRIKNAVIGIPDSNNIVFTGLLDEEEIPEYYRAADVFILPSVQEALSYSLLEAMACGLPVIARRGTSGNSRVVLDGVTGLYFDDTISLAVQLSAMSTHPDRISIGENAANLVRNQYTIQATTRSYLDLYQKLIAKK